MDETRSVEASEFAARCQELLAEVQATRVPLVILQDGKPVAELTPRDDEELPPIFGWMKGTVTILGDIVEPLDIDWGIHAD